MHFYLCFLYCCIFWDFSTLLIGFLKLKSMKVNLLITGIYIVLCYLVFVLLLQLPIYKVGILGELFRF